VVDPARYSPPFALVRAHFAAGVLGLATFAGLLLAHAAELGGHHFQKPHLLLVHVAALGWLMPVALGAMLQLVPVLFEAPLASWKIGAAASVLYAVGASGLVGHLGTLSVGWGLPLTAAMAAGAIWIHAAVLVLTVVRGRASGLTAAFVLAALAHLLFAVTLGFLLAWNLCAPYLPLSHLVVLRAHAHSAALGFFGMLVMGAGLRLMEMFLVSRGAPELPGWIAFGTLNAALVLLDASSLLGPWEAADGASAALAAVGIGAFAMQARLVFVRRVRRHADATWLLSGAGLAHLASAAGLGLALALGPAMPALRDRLVLAYGLVAIVGFAGSVVVGQLYKIVPFLVWLHRFAPLAGTARVPAASELLAERPKRVQAALMQSGIVLVAAGILNESAGLRTVGAGLFAASALAVAGNLWAIDRRKPFKEG